MDRYRQAAASIEQIPPSEADQIREIAELMVKLLDQRYAGGRSVLRGVHPKAHACVQASFRVRPDLPQHLRVGMFAIPGATYDAVLRFSNAAALVGPDVVEVVSGGETKRTHGSRGMALKVRGVPGRTFLSDDEPGAQDFLMVNAPVFPFANVADYLALTRAQLAHRDESAAVFAAFAQAVAKDDAGKQRVRRMAEITAAIQATPVASPLQSSYFSAAPFLFGHDHVAKFAAVPVDPPDEQLPEKLSDDYLRDVLVRQIREKVATFDFCVQLRPVTEDVSLEDVTVEWERSAFPLQILGRVTIPTQECGTPEAINACERLFFTPWHSVPEFTPVGGINRLRKTAYEASFSRRTQPLTRPEG